MLGVLALAPGCAGPPQFDAENREIIVSLATAVSTRNPVWLESNERLIEERRAAGRLSDAQYQTLMAIVTAAKSDDWKSAVQMAYALREAQVPSPEDYQKLAQRKLAPEHSVPKSVANRPLRGRAPH